MSTGNSADVRMTPLNVGVMPSDWPVASIADIAVSVNNGFVGQCLQHQCSQTDGVLYLQGFNVRPNRIDLTERTFVTKEFAEKQTKSQLREGDVLTVQSGHIGTTAVVPRELAGANCHALIITRPRRERVFAPFLASYLNSYIGQARLRGLHVGSSIQHINTTELAEYRVPLPPFREQLRIAEILLCWDAAIASVVSNIEAKHERKRGLMQRLLTGKARFKQFDRERWHTFRLGELFTERVEIGRTDLSLVAITGRRGVVPRDTLAKRDTSSEDKSKYLRIAPGDIGYNTMRMWQGVSGLSTLEGIVSPAYTICIPSEKINAQFAAYLFKHAPVVNLFRRYSQGLVDDTLALKFPNFAQIHVTIPDVPEQRSIATVLSACDGELYLLQNQIDALNEQKRGLMQKLLTGQIRIKALNLS